jgi:alanyl-tRNA synthetase
MGDSVIVLGSVIEGKPRLIAATTKAMTKRGVHAGNLIRQVAKIVEGGGGGRPDMAQAGGSNPDRLPEALARVPALLEEMTS